MPLVEPLQRLVVLEHARAIRDELKTCLEPDLGIHLGGSCLLSTLSIGLVLEKRGIPHIAQAGSFSWPRIDMDQDDGVSATHFSYVFDWATARSQLAGGRFPEMHCWIVCDGEVIDLETGDLPRLCEKLAGLPWTGATPPAYLWGPPPPHTLYHGDGHALRIALRLMSSVMSFGHAKIRSLL